MFNIKDFIMSTLKGMYGNYPDFQIREYALNWYAKGKLAEEDLAEIEMMLNPIIEEENDSIDNYVEIDESAIE